MGLMTTISAERVHIGFFGVRNAGKSSVVNVLTGQDMSVVSDIKGTTTNPIRKTMELLPLGPVVIIDTPGIDDRGILGEKRAKKANETMSVVDIAVLVVDGTGGFKKQDRELIAACKRAGTPYVVAVNKADLPTFSLPDEEKESMLALSALTGEGIEELKERLGALAHGCQDTMSDRCLVADLLVPHDTVLLVVPLDESAPKGRLILPQQQVIREILEIPAQAVICSSAASGLSCIRDAPKMVITDSQVFDEVSRVVPDTVLLTSFSILFARYKGDLALFVRGAQALRGLKDTDKVLIAEGCTHHRQCSDIGTVKLPRWIAAYTGARPAYSFTSGRGFPKDLTEFSLIIHCGSCMLTQNEMKCRIEAAVHKGVPIVNYGVAIACMHGILERALEPFGEAWQNMSTAK